MTITETTPEITTSELINTAFLNKIDLVVAEKLLELRAKDDAFKARKVYAKDFATAQANILPVVKSKTNKHTQSNYSDLADIIGITQPIYTKEGFSVTFNEGETLKENHVRILADVLHFQGHKESYHLDVPLDGVGFKGNANMTAIQGKASSISYGRRYLMYMIWNIPTPDNDGNNNSPKEVITTAQLHTLRDLLIVKELTEAKLLAFLKIESLEELPAKRYMEAMQGINAAVKVVKK